MLDHTLGMAKITEAARKAAGTVVVRDAFHTAIRAAVERARNLILLPAPTLGEMDYLLRVRLGTPRCCGFWKTFKRALLWWSL